MQTPVLDSLANNGLRYTNFHSTGVCSPSRAALLTGRNHHSVHMGTLNYSSSGFPGGFGPAPGQVHHYAALPDDSQRRYGLERFLAETRRLYGVMDRRLADRAFFAGDLSIADFAIVGWVWRHARHQVDLVDYPHVQRWYQAMLARPAVARGFEVPLRHG